MTTVNDLPSTVSHRIIKGFGSRTLARLGAIGKPGIAEAARGLMAERQEAVTAWCTARLQEFQAIHNRFQEAVWSGDAFRPGIAPRDDFLPLQDEIGPFQAALKAAGEAFDEVTVRPDGLLCPTGNNQHRYAQLRVIMTASMPPLLEGTHETVYLVASIYFGRDEAWGWERVGAMRIRLITPSLDVSWAVEYDPSVPLDWSQVRAAWRPVPHAQPDKPIDRRSHFLEHECIQDVPALVRVCFNDDVANHVASILHSL